MPDKMLILVLQIQPNFS